MLPSSPHILNTWEESSKWYFFKNVIKNMSLLLLNPPIVFHWFWNKMQPLFHSIPWHDLVPTDLFPHFIPLPPLKASFHSLYRLSLWLLLIMNLCSFVLQSHSTWNLLIYFYNFFDPFSCFPSLTQIISLQRNFIWSFCLKWNSEGSTVFLH